MESTDTTLVSPFRSGNSQLSLGNRLHVRVSVLGNELELTDERTDGKTNSVNIQELVSAFTGILKSTIETTPATSQNVIEKTKDNANISDSQELKAELIRLKHLVQKFEGKNEQLKKLIHESKKESEQLKIRFRTATHMKAAEVAERFSQANAMQNATNHHGHESGTDSGDRCTPEQEPMEFELNSHIKEIDFLSLDDILGTDETVDFNSKMATKDLLDEDDNVDMENLNSGSRSNSSSDENFLRSPNVTAFALPLPTPPSVLKIGLDPDVARAGGKCTVESSHGSPDRRSPRSRGESSNRDPHTEHGNAIETDEEHARSSDSSMVNTYGIKHNPSPDDGSYYKAVLLGNLPQDIDYHMLLAKVRGGSIISATLCDTTKIRGCRGRKSALVVFHNAIAARAYVQFANTHGIYLDSERTSVRLIDTPTYPLSTHAENRIKNGQTRYLVIEKSHRELSLSKIDRIISFGVNDYRADAIDRFWKDECGNVRIRFASINAASMGYWKLSSDPNYGPSMLKFEKDPCGRPLSDLLPAPTGRKVSGFANMKVNYDEDDSDDENAMEIKLVSLPTTSKVNKAHEIKLEDGDYDIIQNKPTKDNEERTEIIEAPDISDATLIDEETTVEGSETSVEANAAEAAIMTHGILVDIDCCRGAPEPKTSENINAGTSSSTGHVKELHSVLKFEDFKTDKNISILESVTFSPAIPQKSGPVADPPLAVTAVLPSTATIALESWADEAIEAAEAGTLEPPVGPKTMFPPTSVIDTGEEIVYPLIKFLPTIVEEDLFTCEPIEEEPVTDIVAETPDVFSQSSATDLPAGIIEKSVAELSPKLPTVVLDKFDLTGTDLDPAFVAAHAFQTVLSQKPRGGLSTSRWANPKAKGAELIIVEAPLDLPTLQDRDKAASELLFGKVSIAESVSSPHTVSPAPPHVPKGPRAGVPGYVWASPEISHESPIQAQPVKMQIESSIQGSEQYKTKENEPSQVPNRKLTGPKFMPCKPHNGISTSRYAGLDSMAARPRPSLRDFYKAVDSQSATPKNLDAAVPARTNTQTATTCPAKLRPGTTSPDQHSDSRDEAGTEPGLDGL